MAKKTPILSPIITQRIEDILTAMSLGREDMLDNTECNSEKFLTVSAFIEHQNATGQQISKIQNGVKLESKIFEGKNIGVRTKFKFEDGSDSDIKISFLVSNNKVLVLNALYGDYWSIDQIKNIEKH